MKSLLLVPAFLFLFINLDAQVAINSNNTSPDSSAILDVQSTDRGILIPRMTSAQRMAISSPAAGLLLYQTDGAKGLWFYNGTEWMVGSVFALLNSTVSNANGDYINNDFVFGSPSLNYDGDPDHNSRMFFDKDKFAFRAGYAQYSWDTDSIGLHSVALGFNNYATNSHAISMGKETVASGRSATALGIQTEARGDFATALGRSTVASGLFSTSMGVVTQANGESSTALGSYTVASGSSSTSMGSLTQANAVNSTSIGLGTMAHGYASTVIGMYNDTIVTTEETIQNTTPLFIIGNGSSGSPSNAMVVRKDGRVGIGISAPRYDLHVGNGNISATNMSNTRMAVTNNSNGQRAAILGLAKTGGGAKVEAQFEANGSANAGPSVIVGSSTSHPLYLRTGNITRMTVSTAGNIGIGTLTSGYKLEVNGDAAKPSGGSWTSTSDRRLKSDIHEYDAGLTDILRIRPVKFHYNQLSGYDTDNEHVGVIAQDLQEICPNMVGTYHKDGVEYLNVNNSAMTYMLINAVQELNNEKTEMKVKLDQQQQQLDHQHDEIGALKKQTNMLINSIAKLSASTDY